MIKRLAILAAASLALMGCGYNGDPDNGSKGGLTVNQAVAPSPILYEISDDAGSLRGWVFGTIHSLPADLVWRTPALEAAISGADTLVVEIAELDDSKALFDTFNRLATSPDQPDIGLRVPEFKRPELFALVEQAKLRPTDFGNVETWAAALIIAQAVSDGDSAAGADRVLVREFDGRPVLEFEGAELQLGIFDQLPESEQSDLLVGVIDEERSRAEDPDKLRRAWLAGDEEALIEATNSGLLADPELKAALLIDRNRAWIDQLVRILNRGDTPLVAVGAAHIVGEESLPALLTKRGFELRRVQ